MNPDQEVEPTVAIHKDVERPQRPSGVRHKQLERVEVVEGTPLQYYLLVAGCLGCEE